MSRIVQVARPLIRPNRLNIALFDKWRDVETQKEYLISANENKKKIVTQNTAFASQTMFIYANFGEQYDSILFVFHFSHVLSFVRINGKRNMKFFVIDKCKKGFSFFHISFSRSLFHLQLCQKLGLKRPIVHVEWMTSTHACTKAR